MNTESSRDDDSGFCFYLHNDEVDVSKMDE